MSQTFTQKVAKIQKELKAPKSQRNKFGNYNYRNQEDILEAVKPLLGDLVLTISDEIVEVGGRIYVKATCVITDGTNSLTNVAYAREPQEQKGMSDGQLTGATSSYARKYSLNGLFLIDDTKDADTNEYQGEKTEAPAKTTVKTTPKVEAKAEAPKVAVTTNTQVQGSTASPNQASAQPTQTPAKKAGWGGKRATTQTTNNGGDLY